MSSTFLFIKWKENCELCISIITWRLKIKFLSKMPYWTYTTGKKIDKNRKCHYFCLLLTNKKKWINNKRSLQKQKTIWTSCITFRYVIFFKLKFTFHLVIITLISSLKKTFDQEFTRSQWFHTINLTILLTVNRRSSWSLYWTNMNKIPSFTSTWPQIVTS